MTQKPTKSALLYLIQGAETKRGYDAYSDYAVIAPPKPPTQMTVNETKAWQRSAIRRGSKSVAIGGYQMISKTFNGVVSEMGLTGSEVMTPELQDSMGMHLLERRGYGAWRSGQLTDDAFMDNLAHEWAALPRATGPKRGRSEYSGDGLNGATVNLDTVMSALTADRDGTPFDFKSGPPSAFRTQATGTPTGSTHAADRELLLNDLNPDENYSGADVGQTSNLPNPVYKSAIDERVDAKALEANTPTFWEGAGMAADEGMIHNAVLRQLGKEEFAPQDGFEYDQELWDEVTVGIPEVYQRGLDQASSPAEARALGAELKRSYEQDVKLSNMGWTGIGLRFGAAIADPVAIGISLGTEGVMAPVLYAEKAGRLGRFLRAGTAAAAVNAGIEGYLVSESPTKGMEDVAYAAAAGFVLGGAFGAFGKSHEARMFGDEVAKLLDDVEAAEIPLSARAASGSVSAAADGTSSVGAAQVGSPVSLPAYEQAAAAATNAPYSALGKLRIDIVGRLKQSENDITRKVAALFGEDGVGNADGSVNVRAASENISKEMRTRMARFYGDYNESFRLWAQENGKSSFRSAADRAEFNNAVGKAVRRELDGDQNPHVQKIAASMKRELGDLLKFGQDMNIRGFSDVKANSNYLTRRHRIERLDELVAQHGAAEMRQLVAKSLRDNNTKWRNANSGRAAVTEDISYEDSLDIAKAYIDSIRSRKYGQFDHAQAFSGQDADTLRMMLQDQGMAADTIDNIITKVSHTRDLSENGRISEAKWRLGLDETASIDVLQNDKSYLPVGIEDFLENDAEVLFSNYTRSVLGAGFLEESLSNFKVTGANGEMAQHAPSWATVKGYIAKNSTLSQAAQKAEFATLDKLYNAVKGVPQGDTTKYTEAMRVLRDYNFIRIGGQLGVAQGAEIGNILGHGGVVNMLKHMPALRHVFKNARESNFSDDYFNELEAIWGFGTDLTRQSPAVRMDDAHGSTFEGRDFGASKRQQADFLLQQGKKVTSITSGMSHVNMVLQRMNSRVLVQRFMDNANGGRQINAKRLATLGVSPEMAAKINAQMLSKVSQSKGMLGRKVSLINIEKWDDIDAKNTFINAVDRWAKTSVQENDIGNMPEFMTSEMGKSIFQFRSFMLAAYTKQTLNGIHHRDREAWVGFMTSMFFGTLFYAGQQVVNAQGRSDKKEFLEERLSPTSLGKAGFQRAAHSSLVPVAIDFGIGFAGIEPVFDFRSSGLKNGGGIMNTVLSNPSGDLLQGLERGIKGATKAAFTNDYDFSQKDWKAVTKLFFFQNAFGIRNATAALGADLPTYSQ